MTGADVTQQQLIYEEFHTYIRILVHKECQTVVNERTFVFKLPVTPMYQ